MSNARLTKLEAEMVQVKTKLEGLDKIKKELEKNNKMTEEMYETFSALAGGFRVLKWLGDAAKPVAYLIALGGAIVALFKTGVWTWPSM